MNRETRPPENYEPSPIITGIGPLDSLYKLLEPISSAIRKIWNLPGKARRGCKRELERNSGD